MRKTIALMLAVLMILTVAFSALAQTDAEIIEGVLSCFEQLAAVPRPTHHEEKISAYLLSWALEKGFDAYQDKVGNVIFDVPATAGLETAPVVALQAHMDMVAVSDDPGFDPLTTPIRTVRGDNTLTADGTSLGADDGIGVATIMHLATSQAAHGPLRAIITVNEEDGMAGIFNMDASVVEDVTYLINLDAETIGEAVVSTAAGEIMTVKQTPNRVAPTFDTALSIKLDGLQGGHSGVMIDKGRANAIQHLCDMLLFLRGEGISYELASLTGGDAPNAIPGSAEAVIVVAAKDAARVRQIIAERDDLLAFAYSASDAGLKLYADGADMPATVFEGAQAANIIAYAALVIDGVHSMSPSVPGLVESSSNLGVVKANDDEITYILAIRSSQEALLNSIHLKHERLAELMGFNMTFFRNADAWPAVADCRLYDVMKGVYREQSGGELKLVYVHAGLECGTFARMKRDLQMISIGPELHDVHTVNETLYLDSLAPFYRLVEGTLLKLAQVE